jgi:hypothetical protein
MVAELGAIPLCVTKLGAPPTKLRRARAVGATAPITLHTKCRSVQLAALSEAPARVPEVVTVR